MVRLIEIGDLYCIGAMLDLDLVSTNERLETPVFQKRKREKDNNSFIGLGLSGMNHITTCLLALL